MRRNPLASGTSSLSATIPRRTRPCANYSEFFLASFFRIQPFARPRQSWRIPGDSSWTRNSKSAQPLLLLTTRIRSSKMFWFRCRSRLLTRHDSPHHPSLRFSASPRDQIKFGRFCSAPEFSDCAFRYVETPLDPKLTAMRSRRAAGNQVAPSLKANGGNPEICDECERLRRRVEEWNAHQEKTSGGGMRNRLFRPPPAKPFNDRMKIREGADEQAQPIRPSDPFSRTDRLARE
jgi:hypothetical protein